MITNNQPDVTYSQSTGALTVGTNTLFAKGYSGHGLGLNNPVMQDVIGVGPIPQGDYVLGAFFDDLGGKGPVVCHLYPASSNRMFNRAGFMIHGDNEEMNHTASDGCIILNFNVRLFLSKHSDTIKILRVID